MVALARYKLGEVAAAQAWLARCLAACLRQKGDRVFHNSATQLIVAVGTLSRKERWLDLLERAAEAYLEINEGRWSRAPFSRDEGRSAPLLWAAALAEARRWEDLYRWAIRIGPDSLRHAPRLLEIVRQGCEADAMESRLLRVVEQAPSPDAYRGLALHLETLYASPERGARILKAARAKISDARLELETALLFLRAVKQAEAAEAAAHGLQLAEKYGDVTLEKRLAIMVARLHLFRSDRAGAARVVLRLVERHGLPDSAHLAEVCEFSASLQEPAQAVRLLELALRGYRVERERGFSPFLQIGRIQESLSTLERDPARKRDHAIEAVRYYNGHVRSGSTSPPWPEGEELTIVLDVEGASSTATAGRKRMIELLGEDFFIRRFLESPLPALSDNARAALEKHVETLADTATPSERRVAALERARAAGPAAAPLLHSALARCDAWAQFQIRELLDGWAEPAP